MLDLSVSRDGEVAVGFLDKTLRVYAPAGDKDWCGFDSGVNLVEYSTGGEYLAAAGGEELRGASNNFVRNVVSYQLLKLF